MWEVLDADLTNAYRRAYALWRYELRRGWGFTALSIVVLAGAMWAENAFTGPVVALALTFLTSVSTEFAHTVIARYMHRRWLRKQFRNDED